MNLRIGLTASKPGWQILLKQEGVSYEIISCFSDIKYSDLSALIANGFNSLKQRDNILGYVKSGGAVLVDSEMSSELLNVNMKKFRIKFLIPEKNSIYSAVGLVDIYQNGFIPKDGDITSLDNGLKIKIKEIGKGIVLILPFNVNKAILDISTSRRKFCFKRKELPSERVSKISKGEIRRIVRISLEYLHHIQGLPFVQLWYYPKGNKNIFSFRVDTDFCKQKDTKALYKICKKNEIPGSWFVETKTSMQWLADFKNMQNQEIGLHCYRHRVFKDYDNNRKNLEKGQKILEKYGIKPIGFVSPYGEWNYNLGKAIEDANFQYSSEFSLSYDDLPFFPYIENRFSKVLQIPIHPISIGRLRRAHCTDEEMWQYYKNVIVQKIKLCEPIIFYHHPSHKKFDIFDRIFKFINEHSIKKFDFAGLYNWWKKRNKVKFNAILENEKIVIESNNFSNDFWLRISSAKFGNSITQISPEIDLRNLEWHKKDEIISLPQDINHIRRFSWRDFLYDLEFIRGKLHQWKNQ
ncbi:MAG: polysaccharide deacetylase family protein [Candidatus Cloacimonadota bacterium]|nr:polysaccharide deacetylase family protein [Candidatus Cloacimonadota bacterium]